MSTRILIIEDHPLFADALMVNLNAALPRAEVSHAASLRAARDMIAREPTLVVLDLDLPDAQGFEALIEMRRLVATAPILVVSAYCDDSIMERGKVFGATGFVSKCETREVIVDAARRLLAGEILDDRRSGAEKAGRGRLKALTTQQLRVLQLVCQGLLNKQIAHQLDVSEATIKAHVGEILHKLGVSTRTQAVAEMSRAGAMQAMAFAQCDPRMPERR